MAEVFPLFENNEISNKFISILSKCNNPHFICLYGDARIGKSTKLNQIINGTSSNNYYSLQGPFKIKSRTNIIQTKGCDFYGPINVKDLIDKNEIDIDELDEFDKNILNDELFLVDTEGLNFIDASDRTNIAGILSILQIACINILYMTNLENEKLEETAKITKLTNILNIFNNTHETIVLLRDIPLNEEFNTVFQIVEELSSQKSIFDDRIDIFFDKFQIKRALLELLPNYELAKNDFEEYSEAYKIQMRRLILTFLKKIKNSNNNINGNKLIEIIKHLIEMFNQVDNIEIIKNSDKVVNSFIKNSFEQTVKKFYSEIKYKINHYDKNIICFENKNGEIQKYLIDYIKFGLKDIWNIYYNSIKNDIDIIIEKYQLKLNIDILNTNKTIQEKINNELRSILSLSKNKEITDFFSKFSFFEEINKEDINKLIKNIMDNFTETFKKELDCNSPEYKENIHNYLKKELEQNLHYKINSMPKREGYLIKVLEDIKNKISSYFVFHLLKSTKKEVEKNLDLSILKQKIELYCAQNNIIAINNDDFKKKLNELYEDIKAILKERINSLQKEEEIKNLTHTQLKGKTITDGIYIIKPINCENKVVQIENNGLVIWDFKDENYQKFFIKYDPFHACYKIKNIKNNLYLTCDDFTVYFTNKNNNINQEWHIVNKNYIGYEIILEKNKKIIQVEENVINGSKISCEEKKGSPNQIFDFKPTNEITCKKHFC